MNYFNLSEEQRSWQLTARTLSENEIGPMAPECDAIGEFPYNSLKALQREGLWALRVPKEHGGLGGDLLTTCLVVEEIAKKCPSTAMCYKMHLESVEAVTQIHSDYQLDKFVKPLARGELFAAAAGGESHGQDGKDWRPSGRMLDPIVRSNGTFILNNVRKSYVTSAGHATHYQMFVRYEGSSDKGPPELLMIEADQIECQTVGTWDAMGMRGTCSAPMVFSGSVPEENLVGFDSTGSREPIMNKYMMPLFFLTYGAAYLGIASGALELGLLEGGKKYGSGSRRIDSPINVRRFAEISTKIELARAFLHSVASLADAGKQRSLLPYLQAKVICSETATVVTEEILTVFGGTAYAKELPFERYFRDARAGKIMGRANDQIYEDIIKILFPSD